MWCSHCQSETKPIKTPLGLRCAKCEISISEQNTSQTTIREARDIVAKWSSSDLMEQLSTLSEIPAMPSPHFRNAKSPESTKDESTPASTSRLDEAEESSPPSQETTNFQPPTAASTGADKTTDKRENAFIGPPRPPRTTPSKTVTSERAPSEESRSDDTIRSRPDLRLVQQETPASDPIGLGGKPPLDDATVDPQTDHTQSASSPVSIPLVASSQPSAELPPSKRRRLQQRNEQRRKYRPRKSPAAAESKGVTAVKRNLRVDRPGQDSLSSGDASLADERKRDERVVEESPDNVAGGKIQSNSAKGGRRHRIDSGQPVDEMLETGDARLRTQTRPKRRYIDEAHDSAIRGPHFQVTTPRRSNLTSMTGQFLAYIGVLGLTVGTAMVIYGHFGGHSQYTPTGWLVTTVAQMMLFLGVINLVSGGMEQNNEDVSARINHLGEQLLRIEQVTEEALRGPKISARRYADPNSEVEESEREVVYQET